jgi:uncharacterized membrane protein (UPF0127 family)
MRLSPHTGSKKARFETQRVRNLEQTLSRLRRISALLDGGTDAIEGPKASVASELDAAEPGLAPQSQADGGIRTLDPRFTRAVLWPTELRRRCGDECSPRLALLCVRLVVADSWWARARGLAWRQQPPKRWAPLFPRCRSVHTFGMRFPIDVVFLDLHGWPIQIRRGVKPGRIVGCRHAAAVIEMRVGAADRHFVVLE